MLIQKKPFSQNITDPHMHPQQVSVARHSSDSSYQRIELLLIGFASVFITFLWVGVFSALFQNRAVHVPLLSANVIAPISRNLSDQVSITTKGFVDAGIMAKDTIAYQFVAIGESSCLTQQSCTGFMETLSQKASSALAITNNIAANSQVFISFVRNAGSFRLKETGESIAQLVRPDQVYAAGVLGDKTVLPEQVLSNVATQYYTYVDTMTFGAVSAIDPTLTKGDSAR